MDNIIIIANVTSFKWLLIGVKFPDTLIEIFTFQFTGNLEGTYYINNWIAGIYGIIFCLYIIYCVIKNKKQKIKELRTS